MCKLSEELNANNNFKKYSVWVILMDVGSTLDLDYII